MLILVLAGFGVVQVVRSVVTDGDAVADGAAAPVDTTVASGSAPAVDPC